MALLQPKSQTQNISDALVRGVMAAHPEVAWAPLTIEAQRAQALKLSQMDNLMRANPPSSAIPTPNAVGTADKITGTGGLTLADSTGSGSDSSTAQNASIKGDIKGKAAKLIALYNELFGKLDQTVNSEATNVEKTYGDQLKTAGDTYAKALPAIQNSYAALGAADSTDNTYAHNDAKAGFDTTTKTIGDNKQADLTKVSKAAAEKKATYQAGIDSVNRNLGNVDSTTDTGSLESMRGNLDTGLSDASVESAKLGSDASFADSLKASTADSGRFDSAMNALDGIINSSMSGSVKQAAVKSIVDSAGLTDAEKKQVDLKYGNVFNEQNVA